MMQTERRRRNRRRSKLEINLTILKAIKSGVNRPTRIMYAAYLSWNPAKARLEDLRVRGYIREESHTSISGTRANLSYTITAKGEALIDRISEISPDLL